MTRKTHRQRRRAYERRRRTRRRQYQQQGGEDGQKLTEWLIAANSLRDRMTTSNGYSSPWDFQLLKNDGLTLTTAPDGPALQQFEPSSLGDIITNIAATFNTPIPDGQRFNEIMGRMKTADPEVYQLLQKLEGVLRYEGTIRTKQIVSSIIDTSVDLTSATIEKPHFLWIAYANLQAEAPEHPVLLKELPSAPTPTPVAPTQQVAAPTQTATTLPPAVPSRLAQ